MIVWYSAPPASCPDPRLTARSMLSLGTEVFLAFWMASKRVGLPTRSPPPVRAATSMFLISLANTLARRASTMAFLCLVVAHLECPDMLENPSTAVGDDLHEKPVQAEVPSALGVAGRRQHVTLTHRDDPTGGGAA